MYTVEVMKLIVFVCVSNTCRSPMCEYLLRDKLQKAGLAEEFTVVSRSLSEAYEPQGSPANEQGQLVISPIIAAEIIVINFYNNHAM